MALHIGNIIHDKVKLSQRSVKEVAAHISRSENTMYDIYKRESIDTNLLLKLSEILEFNFFALFNQEEPILLMRDNLIENLNKSVEELREQILLKEEHIKNLKEIIIAQKEAKEKNSK